MSFSQKKHVQICRLAQNIWKVKFADFPCLMPLKFQFSNSWNSTNHTSHQTQRQHCCCFRNCVTCTPAVLTQTVGLSVIYPLVVIFSVKHPSYGWVWFTCLSMVDFKQNFKSQNKNLIFRNVTSSKHAGSTSAAARGSSPSNDVTIFFRTTFSRCFPKSNQCAMKKFCAGNSLAINCILFYF